VDSAKPTRETGRLPEHREQGFDLSALRAFTARHAAHWAQE
jgi:hypothetical protein